MKKLTFFLMLFIISSCSFRSYDDLYEDDRPVKYQDYKYNELLTNNFPLKDGRIFYQGVDSVSKSLTATELFINAKSWSVEAFRSSKAVIEVEDKDMGLLILKSYFEKGHNSSLKNPKKWFKLKIETKDGRYRYTLYDVWYDFTIPNFGTGAYEVNKPFEDWLLEPINESIKRRKKIYEKFDKYCKEMNHTFVSIIKSLSEGMNKKDSSNW